MRLTIFPGFEERVIIVMMPADEAALAAATLADIPPLPNRDPTEETLPLSFLTFQSGDSTAYHRLSKM